MRNSSEPSKPGLWRRGWLSILLGVAGVLLLVWILLPDEENSPGRPGATEYGAKPSLCDLVDPGPYESALTEELEIVSDNTSEADAGTYMYCSLENGSQDQRIDVVVGVQQSDEQAAQVFDLTVSDGKVVSSGDTAHAYDGIWQHAVYYSSADGLLTFYLLDSNMTLEIEHSSTIVDIIGVEAALSNATEVATQVMSELRN